MRKAVVVAIITFGVLAGGVAAGASATQHQVTSAQVQSAMADGSTGYAPGGRVVSAPPAAVVQGLLRAQRAGVRISRAARRIMEQAPPGSCLNDPIQTKCGPRPKAIVATSATERAHIAAVPQCAVHADVPTRPGGGTAYGKALNECAPTVSEQIVESDLYMKFKDDETWAVVGVATSEGVGGREISATAHAHCEWWGSDADFRDFFTKAIGYADLDGTWYAASNSSKITPLRCIV